MVPRGYIIGALSLVLLGALSCARIGFRSSLEGSDSSNTKDMAGRKGQSNSDDATPSPSSDAFITPRSQTLACSPWTGNWALTPPEPVEELNSPKNESELFLSADGLTAYFGSFRSGGKGGWDVYSAVRPDWNSPFKSISNYSTINTNRSEYKLTVTDDGLEAFLNVEWENGVGGADIWMARREDLSTPFEVDMFTLPDKINSADHDWDPFISADGLRLYYVTTEMSNSNEQQDIVVAQRATVLSPFGSPKLVEGLASTEDEDNPTLTADELVIVFGTNRGKPDGDKDIWYATRKERSLPFETPKPLDMLNTSAEERETYVTRNGCEVYFASNRNPSSQLDFYRSRFVGQ